jgi:SAM-dependent methyltransferase
MTHPSAEPWTKEQIEQLLAEEDFQYQRIDLPFGLATRGRDRTPTARRIFPDDLRGKTVLDVGSYLGFFCFEALKRGAARAVGLEIDRSSVRKAGRLAEVLGLTPEFRHHDIEHDPIDGRFDYVLCLNVLHHFREPIAVLQRLARATREKLVLETVALDSRERSKTGLNPLAAALLATHPVLYAAPTGPGRRYRTPKFVMTRGAIETMLRYHRNTFSRIEHSTSEFRGRYITIAEKRQVRQLVLIAGPSSSAKADLIQRMQTGRAPRVMEAVGLASSEKVKVLDAQDLVKRREPVSDRLFYDYDMLLPFDHHHGRYERDDYLDILETAERVFVVTVGTDSRTVPEVAAKERCATAAQYETWFEFSGRLGPGVVVTADATGEDELVDPAAWMGRLVYG